MPHNNKTLFLTLPFLALAMAGCSTVGTKEVANISDTRPSAGANDGIAYFLPRQLATVTATRTNTALTRAITAVGTAQTKLTAEKTKLGEAEAAVLAAIDALDGAEGEDAIEQRKKQLNRAEVARDAQDLRVEEAEEALKKANDALQTTASTKPTDVSKYEIDVKITLLPPTADPDFALRMNPRHSILRDDETDISVGSNGLLKSSNVVAADRTGDVLVELGSLAGAVIGSGGGGGKFFSSDAEDPAEIGGNCPSTLKSHTAVVDFTNKKEVETLNENLECIGVKVLVNPTPQGDDKPLQTSWDAAKLPEAESNGFIDGIMYRSPIDLPVQIQKRFLTAEAELEAKLKSEADAKKSLTDAKKLDEEDSTQRTRARVVALEKNLEEIQKDLSEFRRDNPPGWRTTEVVYLSLPQAGPISVIPQNAGAFTKTEYTLAFDNGVLTEYDATRPSEAFAVASTPFRIVEGFFGAISKVISLRTGRANDEAALAEAQLKLLNAQAELARGPLANEALLATEQLNVLNAQALLERGGVDNQASLVASQLALLNAQAGLARGSIVNQRLLSVEEQSLARQLAAAELATITSEIDLSIEEQRLVGQLIAAQYTSQIAELKQQEAAAAANQRLIALLAQNQNSVTTNQTQLLQNQLSLLNQQTTLSVAQSNAPLQVLDAQLQAQLQAQILSGIARCIEQQIENGATTKEEFAICTLDP